MALTALAAVAWWDTAASARSMGNMPGTMGMPLLPFLTMWTVMMIAMMLPATTPVVTLWGRMIGMQSRGVVRLLRLGVFLSAYVLAWAVLGAVAWLVLRGIESVLPAGAFAEGWIAAGAFALAGVYQLTPAKDLCLEHCRSPVSLLGHFRGRGGRLADLRIGLLHGLYCIGCCMGLMVVLMGVGLMHLPAMVVLTAMIFAEKLSPGGKLIARTTGVAFLAAALLLMVYPEALQALG
jgi:predicted metal-binding membrane protein